MKVCHTATDPMSDVQTACPDLRTLCESVQTAQMNAARALRDLASSVASANGILQGLPDALRAGRAESYMRHIAYADPHGAFTIAYLVWRQGQFSPVHGHKTWCTYQVLQGELSETHYRWDAEASAAIACGGTTGRATSSRRACTRSTGWATPVPKSPSRCTSTA